MTKTIITPEKNSILLPIPEKYIGKRLEVLIYSEDELGETNTEPVTMASFRGLLSSEEADKLQEFVQQSRDEWERNT